MYEWLYVLTKVLTVLSLKFILSVYPVKNRGTNEGGEGQPAAFISIKHGIPLRTLIVGIPENDLGKTDEKIRCHVRTQINEWQWQVWRSSPNFQAINEPVGTMGSVRTASKSCRVERCKGKTVNLLNKTHCQRMMVSNVFGL